MLRLTLFKIICKYEKIQFTLHKNWHIRDFEFSSAYMNKIFFLLFSFLPLMLFSQKSPEEQKLLAFVKNIAVFNRLYPQEKVYLHFDNTAYFLGETMWFKVYLATEDNLQPSPFSKVVYVELLSPEGYVIETKKLKAENGQCHGDFALRDSLYAGFYEVRAYTRAMLNFGEELVFSRVFPVFNRPAKAGVYEKKMTVRNSRRSIPDLRAKAPKMDKLNLQFFPEGGNLVKGLPCVVAFKATDEQGQAVAVNGKIYNSQNEEIADLTIIHQGMGFFSFLNEGQSCKAKVQYQGKEYTFDLPSSLPAGYVLEVENMRPDEVGIRILKTLDLPDQPLGITFICRGKLLFETFSFADSTEYTLQLSKADFPAGVNQVTLFDAKGEILAERLFFVPAKEEEKIKIESRLRNRLEPYGLVNLDFEAKDYAGQPVKTTFSLAIRDAATDITTAYTANMQSYFLLASDLKGYIEQPDYYFEADDNQHRLALDLLMMTHGWRRYEWQTMAGIKPFEVKYPIEQSIIADGSILSSAKSKPVSDVEVTMWAYSPEKTSKQGKCMTDTAGRFNFDLGDIYGKWDMNLQVKKNKKPQACRILLNRAFSPPAKAFLPAEIELSEQKNEQMKPLEAIEDTVANKLPDELPEDMQTKTHPLPEVVISTKNPWRMKSEGLAYADVVYDVGKTTDDLIDKNENVNIDILDFIAQNNKYFTYYDETKRISDDITVLITHPFYKGNIALFVVDNRLYEGIYHSLQELTDKGIYKISQISKMLVDPNLYQGNIRDFIVTEIESFMISEDRATAMKYCPDCNHTIDYATIFLYTKIYDKRKSQAGIRETKFQGYSLVKEFYQPQYDNNVLPREKDVRRTLYWNHDVQTDSTGVANVQFYNNAGCKDLSVDMEGFAK